MSNIGWSFPENNGGEERGLNNAGIETFSGKRIQSLAREIIQNSLDARKDFDQPVKVTFDLLKVNQKDIPQLEEYTHIFNACYDYWKDNEKAASFFDDAINMLNEKYIPLLKVSDYNTTGLTGARLDRGGHFHSLIKSEGVSNKQGGKGGSFGIGKNAPFATSYFRTIFYATYDVDEVLATQGVAKLVTHFNTDLKTTQGTGYFGNVQGNKPILDSRLFPKFIQNNVRDKYGTDIFVLGFREEEDWEITVLRNIIDNFLVAIYNHDLVITIDGLELNANTLDSYIQKHMIGEKSYDAYYYYHALKEGLSFKTQLSGVGEVELYLSFKENAPKKIAMMRASGMVIDKYNPRGIPKDYAAIFIASGNEINQLLRKMENPEHTAWEPDRIDDKKLRSKAKKAIRLVRKWIRDTIFEEIVPEDTEKIEVDFIGDFLPDDQAEESRKKNLKKGNVGEVKLDKVQQAKQSAYNMHSTESGYDEGDENETFPYPQSNKKSKKKRRKQKGKNGTKAGVSKQRVLEYTRSIFNQRTNAYELILKSNQYRRGYLKLYVLGDDGKELVKATRAEIMNDNQTNLEIKGEKIGPINLKKEENVRISLQLDYRYRAALEVNFYES